MSDKGLTAWEALRVFYNDDLSYLTRIDEQYDVTLWRPFRAALEKGYWRAEGFVEPITPTSKLKPIPAHLWRALDIDPYRDAAFGGGLDYNEVRYFENAPEDTTAAEIDIEASYAKHVADTFKKEGRKTTIGEDLEWAATVAVPREWVREKRGTTRTGEEKKGGRPKRK
jgi:hypothetical protein